MKSLFMILLAGCAVRSYENNYYVVEMDDVPPRQNSHQAKKPFNVYWNVPTMQCASKKVYFDNLYEQFGIIQNDKDRFKGENITILYDPGLFPALFKNESNGHIRFRNGGVPQEGNLTKHLEEFKKELDRSIPNRKFSGVGIIDFESWRPQFRQNFGVLKPYKDISIEIEQKLHWWWKKAWIEEEAKRRFEEAARRYMQTTLVAAKKLRPLARWGFYGFPYCFNMATNNMVEECAKGVPQENDEIFWLWSESTALYPSLYSSAALAPAQLAAMLRGRLREAARCSTRDDILPYFWFRYRDAGFLKKTDLSVALTTMYKSAATGFIIWGSSNDVNTLEKCTKLKEYVQNVFGPAIAKYTKSLVRDSDELNNSDILTTDLEAESPTSNLYTSPGIGTDPEFHWMPPENYSQEVKDKLEEQIDKNLSEYVTNNKNTTVLHNNSVLIDLILNAILNKSENITTTTDNPKTKYDKKNMLQNEFLVNNTRVDISTSIATSQITDRIVTNDPFLSTTNDTNVSELEPQVTADSTKMTVFPQTTSTENTSSQTSTVNTNIYKETLFYISRNETSRTTETSTEKTTDIDYDTLETYYTDSDDDDDDDDLFYKTDSDNLLFNSETTETINTDRLNADTTNTDITKNMKKTQISSQDFSNTKEIETSTYNVMKILSTDKSDILKVSFTENYETSSTENYKVLDQAPYTSSYTTESANTNYGLDENATQSTELSSSDISSIAIQTIESSEPTSSIDGTTQKNIQSAVFSSNEITYEENYEEYLETSSNQNEISEEINTSVSPEISKTTGFEPSVKSSTPIRTETSKATEETDIESSDIPGITKFDDTVSMSSITYEVSEGNTSVYSDVSKTTESDIVEGNHSEISEPSSITGFENSESTPLNTTYSEVSEKINTIKVEEDASKTTEAETAEAHLENSSTTESEGTEYTSKTTNSEVSENTNTSVNAEASKTTESETEERTHFETTSITGLEDTESTSLVPSTPQVTYS